MALSLLDWAIVAAYVVFALWVGTRFSKRASSDSDQFFLSGRTLPWWLAGTSMIATTFASDTPLVVSGWVRDHGIWKNWIWWNLAIATGLTVFLFARYWRRGEIMTTAELAELRYGGRSAAVLRGFLGVYQQITNAIILVWVLLAARKILAALLPIDAPIAVAACCAIALTYSILAGLWGVVVTDFLQFGIAMLGAILLAAIAWAEVDGIDGVRAALADGAFAPETLALVPPAGPGGPGDAMFWTAPFAAFAVYLGLAWWAKDGVDGGGLVVQRIAASRDERQGVLATLWYMIGTWALRPWPWVAVALASLVVLPRIELAAPFAGTVQEVVVEEGAVRIALSGSDAAAATGGEVVSWAGDADWSPIPSVDVGDEVAAGATLARTDSESAYPVMMRRFLPTGLLGLVVASLVAAFMSTVDTHLNLASSFFVNDVYRRFLVRGAAPRHYVRAGRLACVVVMAVTGLAALGDWRIADLFTFFLSFLAGVGPVYVLRWFWWRVRASTEIVAMLASSVSATGLATFDSGWPASALAPGGVLGFEGRLCLVVLFSGTCAVLSVLATKSPDPRSLVDFYRRVRPLGWWGPVRALAPDVVPPQETRAVLVGWVSSCALTYGLLFGAGAALLGRGDLVAGWAAAAAAGALGCAWALRNLDSGPAAEA